MVTGGLRTSIDGFATRRWTRPSSNAGGEKAPHRHPPAPVWCSLYITLATAGSSLGEPPVANVTLEGGDRKVRTDAQGIAYLSGFGAVSTARLLVGLNELDNPDVNTLSTTVEFSPRPGGVTEIDYPIRPTAEVMVSLKLRRADGTMVGLSATRLRLVDGHGYSAEGTTEFDGSANFQSVPAGTYGVELDPEQAQRLRMRLANPLTVVVKPDGSSSDVTGEGEIRTPRRRRSGTIQLTAHGFRSRDRTRGRRPWQPGCASLWTGSDPRARRRPCGLAAMLFLAGLLHVGGGPDLQHLGPVRTSTSGW